MAHPYKSAAHKNDPAWLRGIEKYCEDKSAADVTSTIRSHGGDRKATAQAGYDIDQEKK